MDDAALLARWRDGDGSAGSALFGRHFRDVYAFLRRRVGEPVVAEDLAQDTFAACVRNAAGLREGAKFRTYLFCVAQSRLIDHLRYVARHARPTTGISALPDHRPSPSTSLRAAERTSSLAAALDALTPEHQVIIDLYYVQGFRGPQLADILGLPEPTVRSRLRRAKAALRRQMLDEPDFVTSRSG